MEWAGEEMKGDRELCMAAVTLGSSGPNQPTKDGTALQWASEEMKGDRELCTAAVTQNGMALQWAREEIKDDWGIVSAAIKETGAAFAYASPRIRNNKELRKALAVNDSDFAWASLSKTRETIERTIEG